jgi:hypothetical protein
MSNRPAKVTQSEISRTLKGPTDAGVSIGRFEVDHRKGIVVVYPSGEAVNGSDEISKALGMH